MLTQFEFIQKLFTSGIVYERHTGSYRRLILLHALLYATAIALFFFAWYNYVVLSNTLVSIMDALAGVNACVALIYIRKYKKLQLAVYLGTFNLFIFLLSFAYVNQNNQYGLIWTLFFPLFSILINGRKKGLLFVNIYYLCLFYLAYTGIGSWQNGVWDLTSFIRLVAASTVLTYIVYFMEYSHEKAEEQLFLTRMKEEETMRELKKLSITDALTGLYNRRHFMRVFEEQFHTAQRHGYYFALFILDIDLFKQYNDRYGHHKGDEALCAIAKALQEHMRRSEDYIFRLGGEEFSGICVGENREKLKEQIMGINTVVNALEIEHKDSAFSHILTVSIGVKILHKFDDYDFTKLYKEADESLYEAKNGGRNTIRFHD